MARYPADGLRAMATALLRAAGMQGVDRTLDALQGQLKDAAPSGREEVPVLWIKEHHRVAKGEH